MIKDGSDFDGVFSSISFCHSAVFYRNKLRAYIRAFSVGIKGRLAKQNVYLKTKLRLIFRSKRVLFHKSFRVFGRNFGKISFLRSLKTNFVFGNAGVNYILLAALKNYFVSAKGGCGVLRYILSNLKNNSSVARLSNGISNYFGVSFDKMLPNFQPIFFKKHVLRLLGCVLYNLKMLPNYTKTDRLVASRN